MNNYLKADDLNQVFETAEKIKRIFGLRFDQSLFIVLDLVGVNTFNLIDCISGFKEDNNKEKSTHTSSGNQDNGRPIEKEIDKYSIKPSASFNSYKVEIGDEKYDFKESVYSISVDMAIGNDDTYICVNGNLSNKNTVRIIKINDFTVKGLANLLRDLVIIFNAKNLYIDSFGIGKGLLDEIVPKLKEENILLTHDGKIIRNVIK